MGLIEPVDQLTPSYLAQLTPQQPYCIKCKILWHFNDPSWVLHWHRLSLCIWLPSPIARIYRIPTASIILMQTLWYLNSAKNAFLNHKTPYLQNDLCSQRGHVNNITLNLSTAKNAFLNHKTPYLQNDLCSQRGHVNNITLNHQVVFKLS